MKTHWNLRLILMISVLLIVSLACSTAEYTPWFRDDDEDRSDETLCDEGLMFNYDIHCDETTSPRINNFSGKVFNNSDEYAHNVNFKVKFPNTSPETSCSFVFDEIAPGATVEAICQVTANACLKQADITDDTCQYMSYPEHLDWMAAQEKENPQVPDKEDITEQQTDTFVMTEAYRTQIRQKWQQAFEDYPCQPDLATESFDTWLQAQAGIWTLEAGNIIGEEKNWSTLEAFSIWLKDQTYIDEEAPVTKTWKGKFEAAVSSLEPCQACAPPSLIGDITLTIDLKTCAVTGEIGAGGEGDVTINDCINDQPIDETCTSHGMLIFSGDLSGTVNTDGMLDFNPCTAEFDHTTQWIDGCEWDTQGVEVDSWKDPITVSGFLFWNGEAQGHVNYTTAVCSLDGDWTIPAE